MTTLEEAQKEMAGTFPDGKVSPDDEGGLALQVTNELGLVTIRFGTSVRWFGLQPEQAVSLAMALVEHARAANRERRKRQ